MYMYVYMYKTLYCLYVSVFVIFDKISFWDFAAFSPFWHKQTIIILLRSIKAYLCQGMINFDGVHFSVSLWKSANCLLMLSVLYMYNWQCVSFTK